MKTAIYIKKNSLFNKNKRLTIFKYASEHDLKIVRIYSDKTISRINRSRMLIHSKYNNFEVVLVYQLSDLDANPALQTKIISILRKNNVIVVSVKDSLSTKEQVKNKALAIIPVTKPVTN